jgi:hypothetical protein
MTTRVGNAAESGFGGAEAMTTQRRSIFFGKRL